MSSHPVPDVGQLVQLRDGAIAAIRQIAMPLIADSNVEIFGKDNAVAHDVVTNVDFAVQAALKSVILSLSQEVLPALAFDGVVFEGEEGFRDLVLADEKIVWLLDPLDGTVNFAAGLPATAVSLGLMVYGVPMMGIVVDVASGEVFDAVRGQGARINGSAFRRPEGQHGLQPASLSSGTIRRLIESGNSVVISHLLAPHGKLRLFGSQALQLCWAGCGRLSLNVNREAKLWDDLAGLVFAKEAGASYCILSGDTFNRLGNDDPAFSGAMLFSICGEPRLVEQARRILKECGA